MCEVPFFRGLCQIELFHHQNNFIWRLNLMFNSSLTLTNTELRGILYYLTSRDPGYTQCLNLVKKFKSVEFVRNSYYAVQNIAEVWDYLKKYYMWYLEKRRISSIEELINYAADWWFRYNVVFYD